MKNGGALRHFCTYNNLKVMNSFFRGQRSIIDYIIASRKTANFALDVHMFRGVDVGSDHFV